MAFALSRAKSEDLARAEDPNTTGAELVGLAANKSTAVKVAVASRPDCPMASMFSLAQEEDPKILEALLRNSNVPHGLIVHLAQSRRSHIRDRAHQRLEDEAVNGD
ncbi:MAG: hypothetical protein CVT64_02880 [Actinobacteria bacterium HGW-Actinobacteria-4]|nr:MAG: hypothetical protein CVT64_02880 [Actinobacteria bacterium HGW-Actinobacteria-4]